MTAAAVCVECGRQLDSGDRMDVSSRCAACRSGPSSAVPAAPPPRRGTLSVLGPLLFLAAMVGAVAFIRHPPAGSVAAAPPLVQVTERPRLITNALDQTGYPAAALRARQEGTTVVRLTIGTDGRVERCSVRDGSGSSALDQAACEGMRRSVFRPGRSAGGRLARVDLDLPIAWRLPR